MMTSVRCRLTAVTRRRLATTRAARTSATATKASRETDPTAKVDRCIVIVIVIVIVIIVIVIVIFLIYSTGPIPAGNVKIASHSM